jgi:hypothetical protein
MILLAMSGCHGGVETDLLERQLRLQEDYIYRLEDLVEQYQTQLSACQQPMVSSESDTQTDTRPDRQRSNQPRKQPRDDTPDEFPGADEFRPPVVEPGIPIEPETSAEPEAETVPTPSLSAPTADEIGEEHPPRGENAERASHAPRTAERIVLNPELSGGFDRDGRHGSEGVVAVLEARSADGKPTRAAGQVSFLVINPQKKGADGRVARWDFSGDEVDALWNDAGPGGPLHLELPWPQRAPTGGPLQLWARLITSDGRKLLASLDLDQPAGGQASVVRGHAPRGQNRPTDRFTARRGSRGNQALGWTRRHDHSATPHPSASSTKPSSTSPAMPPATARGGTQLPTASAADSLTPPDNLRPVWKPHR